VQGSKLVNVILYGYAAWAGVAVNPSVARTEAEFRSQNSLSFSDRLKLTNDTQSLVGLRKKEGHSQCHVHYP
jgi:hypothetical protein